MTPEQTLEALGILQEECAEVIQAISKIRRSGFSYRPFGGEKTNWDNFFGEVQDVHAVLRLLGDGLDRVDEEHFARKVEKLKKWSSLISREENK